MSHVFLSYSREDEAEAKQIAAALEATGLAVWWDRTIPPGKTFDQVIEEALNDARWALVLWSETSIGSNWVKAEAEEALRRGILVPVLIDDVRPPLAFRRIEAAELQDWDGDVTNPEFGNLLEVMGEDAPPPPEVTKPRPSRPKPSPRPAPQPGPSPRGTGAGTKIAIGAGIAVLVLLAILVGMNMGRGGETPTRPTDNGGNSGGETVGRGPNEPTDNEPSEASESRERAPSRDVQPEERPSTPEQATTGTITLRYAGDAYACQLDLQITVGEQTVIPQSNLITLSDVPLGRVDYSVSGVIGCPTVGTCNASGAGQLDVTRGGLYDLVWQNTTYAYCQVTFVKSG